MKFLLVDDHALFRHGLSLMLSEIFGDITAVQAGSADEAFEIVTREGDFDLVLLDLVMPGMNGYEGMKILQQRLPETPMVVVSSSEEQPKVRAAFAHGAKGYVPKSSAADVLKHALPLVLSGECYVPAVALTGGGEAMNGNGAGAGEMRGSFGPEIRMLTPRQSEVLQLLAKGQTNKEIARNLDMLEGTVKVHLKAIYQKLNVTNRTQAVVAGTQLGHVQHELVE